MHSFNVHALGRMSFYKKRTTWFPSCNICLTYLLTKICCFGLGSQVLTAFTHNICALFCKSMVVDVCLLLMYIHYQPYYRHSMSLSELLLCFWTNSPWPKNKKIGNKMLLSSKKIVNLWVKNKIKLTLPVCVFSEIHLQDLPNTLK